MSERKNEAIKRFEIAEWAMNYTLKRGADQVAISIAKQKQLEIQHRDQKLDTLKESTQNSLKLQIYTDQRYSTHSTNDLRKNNLTGFIEDAVQSTKYLNKDKFRSLPDPKYYSQQSEQNLQICDDNYDKIETAKKIELAAEIETVASQVNSRIISTTAGYSDICYNTLKIHSNGFQGSSQGTVFSAGASVTVKDKDESRPEDWFYTSLRYFGDLPDPEFLGIKAAEKALRKIGQTKIKSGKYDMIVENRCCNRLLSLFLGPMSAQAIQQKRSFLDGKMGKKIASDKLTLTDQPFLKKGLGSRFFDGEGITARNRIMINKGELQNYYVDNYYGKKLNMELTTGSPSNLTFEQGSESLDNLTKNIKKGILVTGFIGGNSNPTTGDFSFGIVGLLIENGEIVKPVNEMNISGNANQFWHSLMETGNDPYPYSSVRIPSMLFSDVQFSGI